MDRTLIVAPSWVGDAILAEPLVSLLRETYEEPSIDILAAPWCAPVFRRMRGVRRIVDLPVPHGRFDLGTRRRIAADLVREGYARAFVLPLSWKSALIPFLARIPRRIGYRGEFRHVLLNDLRRLDRKSLPRLVDRFCALAGPPGSRVPMPPAPVLVPDVANRDAAIRALHLGGSGPVAILCPGAEYGPAKRWPPTHFAMLARHLLEAGARVWLAGSPNDRLAADAVISAAGESARHIRDLSGRTDLGTAIDLLSAASVVVANDSGLMHAAAAVGVPVVALFGSSSPVYTPPLSPQARVARIDIACSPCFKRECPLGHFKCMRELSPELVYNLARSTMTAS
ncbi:heptosyltransferase II [Burkholderiales bacterium]|nr:heptosyltransferase II [Burkholderiales bacterium]